VFSFKSILSERTARRLKLVSLIYFFLVGFLTWEASPVDPRPILFFLVIVLFLAYLGCGHVKIIFRLTVLALLLTTIDVFCVATCHDLTVKVYASALCRDGWYSSSEHRQGTCSWHGGVSQWRPQIPPWWERFHQ
jgi:hypothetical protein